MKSKKEQTENSGGNLLGTIIAGIVHTGKIHGRNGNHCRAADCIFTPDCARENDKFSDFPRKMTCIRCGELLSMNNAKSLPFLCNRCKGVWRTNFLEISMAIAWSSQKVRDIFFLVAMNLHNIAGIFDPGYAGNPVHLGFVAGTKKGNGETMFFQPQLAVNALRLFRDHL